MYTANHTTYGSFKLENLIPVANSGSKVYTYEGSLTTPPCSEVVNWNIYSDHVKISEAKVFLLCYTSIALRNSQLISDERVFKLDNRKKCVNAA